jgi:hypothetical protein
MKEDDNRMYERYECQFPVKVYPQDKPDDYYYGLTYNYSQGGMYVKTDAKLSPDNYYFIEMLNYSADATGPEKYEAFDAKLRWSKRAESYSTLKNGYYYGYGFEYSSPVVY